MLLDKFFKVFDANNRNLEKTSKELNIKKDALQDFMDFHFHGTVFGETDKEVFAKVQNLETTTKKLKAIL